VPSRSYPSSVSNLLLRLPIGARSPVRAMSRRSGLAGIARNRWTNYSGISGRFAPESVDELDWKAWTICSGIRISAEFLDEERRHLGDLAYKEEYGCEFVGTREQFLSDDQISRIFMPLPKKG